MPGTVGLITKIPRERAERQLHTMLGTLRHEPFYVTGTWCDESMGVYVGWAARKDSFSDGMPLSNEAGNAVLIFSGEDYPEPGTTSRLKARGHELTPDGPSYLVHLYEEDPAFPAGVNGLFHGLLADRARGTVMLFNDRYGMQRLYYHEAKDAFYFGAEAKAILAARPELRRMDARGLGEFIACGCVLENRTLFDGVHALPPASAWVFRNGVLECKASYFQPREWEEQEALPAEDFHRALREVFSRNLPRYFNGRERVAMSLTGGLDTRMILAWHKPEPGTLPCYTFGGSYRSCRDVVIGRKVARACRQSHQVITVGKDFLSRFSHYAERAVYLSDGGIEVNAAPALYSNEKARAIAPVRMTGNYGDQILHGLRMFKPKAPTPGLFSPEIGAQIDRARETYGRIVAMRPVSFSAFRQAPWYHQGRFALEQSQVAMRSPYLDNDLVRTVLRAPEAVIKNNDLRVHMIGDGNPALRRIRTDMGFAGRGEQFPGAILRRYHHFTFKAEYACDYGMPQWVARVDHFFSPLHLERLFLGRHKFWHFRVWYRDVLSGYVQEMLLDPRALSRPYLVPKMVKSIVEGHTKKGRNYTTEIHKLLTLELLHRLFVDAR